METPHLRCSADSLNVTCESSVVRRGRRHNVALRTVTNDISVSTSPQSSDTFVSVMRSLAWFRWMWLPAVTLSVVSRNVSMENRQQHYYDVTWRFHKAKNWHVYWSIMNMCVINAIYLVLLLFRFTSPLF